MKHQQHKAFPMTRRDILKGAGALTLAPSPTLSADARSLDKLHIEVAAKARELVSAGGSISLLMPQGCGANVAPVASRFLEMTGIEVHSREVPVDEINAQLALDHLSGATDYDLALPATFAIPDLASDGVIQPLTGFARQHEPDGFRDGILYSIGDSFDGELYGFQTDGDTYVMFYHRDCLEASDEQARYADRFGIELRIPATWQELDRQMAFFHRPDENRYGGALFRTPGYLAWEWWVRFHAKGIWPFSADLEPQIASEAGVTVLEDMIRASESLYPEARSAGLFENWAHFSKGHIFCNIGWGGSQKFLNGPRSAMQGRMVYGLTPGMEQAGQTVRMPYFNWGWNYVVTASSKQSELAYLFALFASTPEISTLAVREQEGYFDPFRPDHYEDPVIQRTYSPEFLAVHRESLEVSLPDLYLAQQGEYFRALSEWLDAAVNRTVEPEEALTHVANRWSLLNLRAGRDRQRTRWLALRHKYPEGARKALHDLS